MITSRKDYRGIKGISRLGVAAICSALLVLTLRVLSSNAVIVHKLHGRGWKDGTDCGASDIQDRIPASL